MTTIELISNDECRVVLSGNFIIPCEFREKFRSELNELIDEYSI